MRCHGVFVEDTCFFLVEKQSSLASEEFKSQSSGQPQQNVPAVFRELHGGIVLRLRLICSAMVHHHMDPNVNDISYFFPSIFEEDPEVVSTFPERDILSETTKGLEKNHCCPFELIFLAGVTPPKFNIAPEK